jgi:hypothetical protein
MPTPHMSTSPFASFSSEKEEFFFSEKKNSKFPHLPISILLIGLATCPVGAAESHLLHYTARLLGVSLLDITYCVQIDNSHYASAIDARTIGLAELLVHGRSAAIAHGVIKDAAVLPADYMETGRLSGEPNRVSIGYTAQGPILKSMSPPEEKYRVPIPPEKLLGSMDGLAAIVLEIAVASRTNACQGEALVYDGFQLRRATTHTVGFQTLKLGGRNMFTGVALACATKSEMLGGYLKDKKVEPQARPRFSTAWLGRFTADGLLLPAKLSFSADFLGDIDVDLDRSTSGPKDCAGNLHPNAPAEEK